jgi:hypothetical protein
MKNTKSALLMVGLLLSVVLIAIPVQAETVNKPIYAKGDFWNYRSSGLMGQSMDFNIVVNKTSVKVLGYDCYELVAKGNASNYEQTTTSWSRTDNLGTIKSYSYSSFLGMTFEITTVYKQGASAQYKFPLKVGDKWSQNVEYTQNQKTNFMGIITQSNLTVKAKVDVEAVAQETLTVIAGTFDTIKIKMLTNISSNITQYMWYSVKAGTAVKMLDTNNMGTQDPLDDQTSSMELISFKIKPQGGVNWGKTVSSKGEQMNFFIVVILIIVFAVIVVVLDITRAMKTRTGQDPGRYQSVSAQMGARSAKAPVQQNAYRAPYQSKGRVPPQGYRDQAQDDYETYGNYR